MGLDREGFPSSVSYKGFQHSEAKTLLKVEVSLDLYLMLSEIEAKRNSNSWLECQVFSQQREKQHFPQRLRAGV